MESINFMEPLVPLFTIQLNYMRTAILFLIIFLISIGTLRSQMKIEDAGLYKIVYTCKHYYDTTNRNKVSSTQMEVLVGKSYSVFRNAGYEKYLADRAKIMERITNELSTGSKHINLGKSPPSVPLTEIFYKLNSNESIAKESLAGNLYLIKDTLPAINWQIMPDTKKIGGMLCQKAEGRYKGRTYTAWFSSDLPISAGPWALKGLPGTILEASDNRNEVLFLFAGYETCESAIPFSLPKKYLTSTKKDWERMQKAYSENPLQFVNNTKLQNGVTTTISLPPGTVLPKRPVINNPIILSEK